MTSPDLHFVTNRQRPMAHGRCITLLRRQPQTFCMLLTLCLNSLLDTAVADNYLGLYSQDSLLLCPAGQPDCPLLPQALWYFEQETTAVSTNQFGQPPVPVPVWLDGAPEIIAPVPIWLGSNATLNQVWLNSDGSELVLASGERLEFEQVPRLPSNQSFWNKDSEQFFRNRPLRLRGEFSDQGFTARTVWPDDFRLQLQQPPRPLTGNENLKSLVQAESGGAQSTHESRLLWQRSDALVTAGSDRAVLALMLNGAQGDDDEALAGHFAIVTGRLKADGSYADWLVNNFYNLDSYNEKGIIAAPTPMDKYLADLNSGQNFYRPSYMLVLSLADDRLPTAFQQTIDRVFNHFYRHDFIYQHAGYNCAGISIDSLRTLGWQVPRQGVEGYGKAIGGYLLTLLKQRSFTEARQIYDYLTTERSRLYPAQAFDSIGRDLLGLLTDMESRPLSEFEQQLLQDAQQVWFVRIPQLPSSRVFGSAPVYDFSEYLQRTPANRADWQTLESPERTFPEALQEAAVVNPAPGAWPPVPVGLLLLLVIGLTAAAGRRYYRK